MLSVVIIMLICVLFNAILTAYEMAFVSVPKSKLRRLAKDGHEDAKRLLELRMEPERTLSVLQIGISFVAAISAAIGGAGGKEKLVPYFMATFDWSYWTSTAIAILCVVLPLTYVNIIIGELVPKTLALRHSYWIAKLGARWVLIADRILSPFVGALEKSTKVILIAFPKSKPASQNVGTMEVDVTSHSHRQHIINLAQLETRKIRDLVVEWEKVNTVNVSLPVSEVIHVIFTSGHTRLPVIENGEVIGILHTKEFLSLRESGNENWKSIIRPILKVKDNNTALEILKRMQVSQSHMAVVYNAYQQLLGIVTLEDINEAIWGDIYDEDDDNRIKKIYTASKKRPIISQDM